MSRQRTLQKWARVTYANGGWRRFPVPLHHHIYCAGDDYVIGCAVTDCEYWRRPRSTITTMELKREQQWLT